MWLQHSCVRGGCWCEGVAAGTACHCRLDVSAPQPPPPKACGSPSTVLRAWGGGTVNMLRLGSKQQTCRQQDSSSRAGTDSRAVCFKDSCRPAHRTLPPDICQAMAAYRGESTACWVVKARQCPPGTSPAACALQPTLAAVGAAPGGSCASPLVHPVTAQHSHNQVGWQCERPLPAQQQAAKQEGRVSN